MKVPTTIPEGKAMRKISCVLVTLFAGILLIPVQASASDEHIGDECNATIWSGPNTQDVDVEQVQPLIDELRNETKADVRIRTYASEAPGLSDDKLQELTDDCESWQSLDGSLKADMLVYILTPADVVFASGSRWDDYLTDAEVSDIRFEMGDHTSDTESLRTALLATVNLMKSPDSSGPLQEPPGGINSSNSDGSSFHISGSGVLKFFVWILVGVVLVGAAVFVLKYIRARRALETAKTSALAAIERAGAEIGKIQTDDDADEELGLQTNFDFIADKLSERDHDDLASEVAAVSQARSKLFSDKQLLEDDPALVVTRETTIQQCESIVKMYTDLAEQAAAVYVRLNAVADRVEELSQRINSAGERYQSLMTIFGNVQELSATTIQKGLDPGSLDHVADLLQQAKSLIDAGQPGKSLPLLSDAQSELAEYGDRCGRLEGLRTSLPVDTESLLSGVTALRSEMAHFAGDQKPLYTELDKLEEGIRSIASALGSEKPDYVKLDGSLQASKATYASISSRSRQLHDAETPKSDYDSGYSQDSYSSTDPTPRRGGWRPGRNSGGGGSILPSPAPRRPTRGGGGWGGGLSLPRPARRSQPSAPRPASSGGGKKSSGIRRISGGGGGGGRKSSGPRRRK